MEGLWWLLWHSGGGCGDYSLCKCGSYSEGSAGVVVGAAVVVPVAVMVVVEPLLVVFVVCCCWWWCSGFGVVSVAGDGSVFVVAVVGTLFVRVAGVKVVGALL